MKSKLFVLIVLNCFLYYQKGFSQPFQNIQISNFSNPNEVSIAIHSKDSNKLVAGANINQIRYSSDGGYNWKQSNVNSTFGIYGDPVLISDTNGFFYYFHLAQNDSITIWPNWADRIVCQKSMDGGVTWNNGSFTGLTKGKVQDKPWATCNVNTNELAVTWTEFDKYQSTLPKDSSRILFSKSSDGGLSWLPAKVVSQFSGNCKDEDETTEGATPVFGPNNEIYVAWAFRDSLYFDKSNDGGVSWLQNDKVISNQVGGWDYVINGLGRCNGLPFLQCDLSSSPYRGHLYINWTDKRNGANNSDVFLCKSIDGGASWSTPIKVNQDMSGKENFMSAFTIDQKTGYLYILYYDRRNYNDDSTDVYLSVSYDGANSFTDFKVSTFPFLPKSSVFIGDYIGISAVNRVVRPIWTRNDGSNTSIFTAFYKEHYSPNQIRDENSLNEQIIIYPNPTNKKCQVILYNQIEENAEVSIYDVYGKVVSNTLSFIRRENAQYVDLDLDNFATGFYFIAIKTGNQTIFKALQKF